MRRRPLQVVLHLLAFLGDRVAGVGDVLTGALDGFAGAQREGGEDQGDEG